MMSLPVFLGKGLSPSRGLFPGGSLSRGSPSKGVSVLVGGCISRGVSLSRGVCLPSPVNRQTGIKHYLPLRSVKIYKKVSET